LLKYLIDFDFCTVETPEAERKTIDANSSLGYIHEMSGLEYFTIMLLVVAAFYQFIIMLELFLGMNSWVQ